MVNIRKNEKVLNKRNNSVLSMVESIRKNRETIKAIYDTPAIKVLNKSNDSVLSMVESIRKNRETIKAIYDTPAIKMLNKSNDSVLSIVESITKNREIIKAIYDTPAIKVLNKSNDSVLSMVESITKNRGIIKVIYDNPLIKVLNKTNGGFVLVSKSIAKIKPQLEELRINDIFVNNDGTINYSNNLMSLEETVDSMIPYIEEDISIEHKINNSIEDFKKNNPLKYKAIVFIIGFFIMGLAQAYYNEIGLKLINTKIGSYKEIQSNTKIINKKEIKKEVKEELDNKVQDKNLKDQLLNDYRFVTVDCLNVRYTAAKKSNIIYQLNFGQVVRIIYKNKNWTLIEYEKGDGSVYIKGWVYTHYISRFD